MIKKYLILLLIPILLTGCYDYKELNTISIVSATSIDYKDNEYKINVQIINPQAPDKTAVIGAPFIIYEGVGKTIQEAYRKIIATSSRFLYQNHQQLLLITETAANEKLEDIIDFYARDPNTRTEFYVMQYNGSDPINIVTPINNISSISMVETIDTNVKFLGETLVVTFNDLINTYLNPNKEIILPTIKVIGEKKDEDKIENTQESETKTNYEIKGISIYKGNKVKGYLTNEQTKAFNYISNNLKNSIYVYKCSEDKYVTLEIINAKADTSIKENNVNIKIKIKANINENSCNIKIANNSEIQKLQKKIEKSFNEFINNNINTIIKEYDTDIFGFKDIVYKNNYEYYKKIKNNNNWFKNLKINTSTNITISAEGNIFGGLNEKN